MATTTADGRLPPVTIDGALEASSQPEPSLDCLVATLSPEILHIICSFLNIENVLRFRQVCKAFADIGAAYMLPEVSFYMFDEDFDRLRAIANHPIISKHVRSLTYFAEVMDNEVVPFNVFLREYRRELNGPFSMGRHCSNRLGGKVDLQQLQMHHKEYEEIMKKQKHIIEELTDVACLKEVIPKFTSLKQATMSSDHEWYEGASPLSSSPLCLSPRQPSTFGRHQVHQKVRDSPFKMSPLWPGSDLKPEGKRHLKALTAGLISANARLESFRAGILDWKFFKDLPQVPSNLAQTLKYLKRIELHIDADPQEKVTSITRCRKVMGSGIIRKLLKPLEHLEALHVTLYPVEWAEEEWPASLGDIIAPDHKWPCLQEVCIGGFTSNRHDVIKFLKLHKDTLRRVCLRDISLGETSWWKFLPDIRNKLDLEEVCICGDIVGYAEDESASLPDEYWDLSTPDVCPDKIRDSINAYCRGPEKYPDEVPLKAEVVDKHYKQYVSTGNGDSDFEDEDGIGSDDINDEDSYYGDDYDDELYDEYGEMDAGLLAHLLMEGSFGHHHHHLDPLDAMMGHMIELLSPDEPVPAVWDDDDEEDEEEDDDDADADLPDLVDPSVD
ncbi:hypothetical protein BKA67DRAFT_544360 [Truncatella angustata]|uniref:F-box domain-containing protein n=1 Tax=Truncatella angustata TaxID=152316 RepID=A0A9P9A400_9PEZI|nr:uncharacterized protein BKA67DRAFT_544360 [Truncatella angustata]KAH6659404.1 hypothetical protein BKA67DRAFT_544360 [Truncatella angustata]KAH8205588.1 hypothetical protein TruAng_000294 [Truncatella angustata]